MKVRVRCDQNRIFGCRVMSDIEGEVLTIGKDRLRVLAFGHCSHCGLPLSRYRDLSPKECSA